MTPPPSDASTQSRPWSKDIKTILARFPQEVREGPTDHSKAILAVFEGKMDARHLTKDQLRHWLVMLIITNEQLMAKLEPGQLDMLFQEAETP